MSEPIFMMDTDGHYYEAADAFTRYLDEEYKPRSVRFETGSHNENWLFIDGEPCISFPDFYPGVEPNISLDDYMERMLAEAMKPEAERADRLEWFAHAPRAWFDRDARLELMDAQGLHASVMLPSVGVELERTYGSRADGIDLAHAIFRAFNRWLEDDWGYGYEGRLFAVPQVRLFDLDQGLDEFDRVIANGARAVNLHVGATRGECIASTKFDPFWQRVVDSDVAVTLHFGGSTIAPLMQQYWGAETAPAMRPVPEWTAFLFFAAFSDRPIMDTVASMIYWNLFGRYPTLKVVSIENGGGPWLEYLFKVLDKNALHARHGVWPGGRLDALPSEVLGNHVNICPFPEEDFARVIEIMGPDRSLGGSDYPHVEGLRAPLMLLDATHALSDGDRRKVLGLNIARLFKVPRSEIDRLVGTITMPPLEEALMAVALPV